MKKYLLLYTCLILVNGLAWGQSLSPYIPNDAYIIIKCSPETIFKKVDRSRMAGSAGLQEILTDIATNLEDKSGLPVAPVFLEPQKLGINMQQEFYIFLDEQMSPCFLFSLSNVSLFDQWWHDQVKDIAVGNSNGNRMLAGESMAIYWNDKVGLIRAKQALGRLPFSGSMTDSDNFDPLPENIFANLDNAISNDPRFESDSRGQDLYVWVNYARLYQMQNAMVNALGSRFNAAPGLGYDYADSTAAVEPDEDYDAYEEATQQPTFGEGYMEGYDAGFEEALSMYGIDTTAAFLNRQVIDTASMDEFDEVDWKTDEEDSTYSDSAEEEIINGDVIEPDNENIPPPPPAYDPGMTGMRSRDPITKLLGNAFNPQTFMKRMELLNNNLRLSAAVNFEKGALTSHIKAYSNPIYIKMTNAANENHPNKQLLKYLPADRLIFAGSFSINTRNMYNYYKDYFIPLIDSSGIITDLVEAYSILLDEDAIFDMLEGDMMFAVTGVTEIQKTTYQYEQEGEETVMKEVLVSSPFPELLLMLTYRDDSNWKKLLRLGVRRHLIERKGNIYTITKNKFIPEFYIAFNKKILFVTNNKDLVDNKLNSGYTGSQRIRGELKNQLLDNNQSAYLDIVHLMAAAKQINLPGFSGKVENVERQEFRSASIWTEKKVDDSVHSKMIFKMGSPKVNVIETILQMLDKELEGDQSKL